MKPLGIKEKENKMEEMKNEVLQETVEIQDDSYKSGYVQYIDSREVAGMVGKKHTDLIRDIKRYKDQISEINQEEAKRKIAFSDFFIESSYNVEGQSRSYPCYLVTKKGCEFIAHKLTGIKGTKFTATYINRFHEMENKLISGGNEISTEIGDKLVKFMESQQQFTEQQAAVNRVQAEFNNLIMDFMRETIQKQNQMPVIGSVNPFSPGESIMKERMDTLNELIGNVAELCGLEKNKVLHYMYQTLEESMNVNLRSYLNVFQGENHDRNICNFHVVCSIDRLYEKAVEMTKDVIERKKMFG